MSAEMVLHVEDLHAWYGDAHVLHGVSLQVARGELVTLLGRNGSGRTTTLRSITGQLSKRRGQITINGVSTLGLPSHKIARIGVAHCPEERGIFGGLSTYENLTLLPKLDEGGLSESDIYAMFPNLKERRNSPGSRLSGGEQQMLAMARILRTGARILLLDEITEGLAPVIVDRLAEVVIELKKRGFTMLLVEQNFEFSAELSDRNYIMESGRVVDVVPRAELQAKQSSLRTYLGV